MAYCSFSFPTAVKKSYLLIAVLAIVILFLRVVNTAYLYVYCTCQLIKNAVCHSYQLPWKDVRVSLSFIRVHMITNAHGPLLVRVSMLIETPLSPTTPTTHCSLKQTKSRISIVTEVLENLRGMG